VWREEESEVDARSICSFEKGSVQNVEDLVPFFKMKMRMKSFKMMKNAKKTRKSYA